MRRAISAIGKWVHETFDLRDAVLAIGLVLLGAGLWQVWPPAALIVPGMVLTLIAIFADRLNGRVAED